MNCGSKTQRSKSNNQTREEEREIEKAKATTTELEEEGITESVAVLMVRKIFVMG